jgi:tape measure domain-containing protein
MAKRADVELRIKSRNLAAKDLSELNSELDKFVKNQERQADSAALSARSLRELNTEQRELSKIAGELSRRKSLIETLIGRQADMQAAKTRLNEIRAELANLLSTKAKGTFLGDIDKAIKTVKTELVGAEKDFNRAAAGVEKLDTALKAVGVDTTDTASALNQVTSSLNRAQAAVIDQTADINRYARAQDDAAASARKLAEAQRFANEQNARQGARRADAVAAFGGAGFDEWERQRAAVARNGAEVQRVQGIHDRFAAVIARNEKYQRALKTQTDAATGSVQRQGAASGSSASSMDRYATAAGRAATNTGLLADTGRKSLSVYQRIRGEVLSLAAAYVGLYQTISLFSSAMQVAQQRQAINAQLLTANGNNARYAAEDQKFLRAEAERLGLVYDDLAKKYANFAISAKAAGLGDSATKEAFSQAADIVVGMRLAADDADGVFRAFVQIMSKSRVQAEELRGQLGDRLPGAVAAFAKANNLALSDLDEYLKKGKGNVESFLKFLQQYAATVKNSVEAGSQTLFADINRLKTAWNDFLELVATSGTSSELQKAVVSLTAALKGDQGKRFAEDLATAFTAVVRALQFVIENFETFVTLAKLFIALQFAKGIVGIGAAFVETAAGIVKGVTALRAYYTTAVAARTAGAALTVTSRALLVALGPIGIAIGVVSAALVGMGIAASNAEARMDSFIATMRTASRVKNSLDVDLAESQVQDQLDETTAKLKELQQIQADSDKWAPNKQWSSAWGMVSNDIWTTGQLEIAITTEQQKQVGLQTALANLERKRAQFKANEAAEDEARRKEEEAAAKAAAAAAAKAAAGDGDKAKTPKQLMAEENARANAARALQKEILDLDQQIFDARIDGEARTAEEINKNYELAIRKIESQIAEKFLDLDRLEQNARTAQGGSLTAADAASLQTARQRVEQLNLELNKRAMIASQMQEVAIAEKAVNDLIAERDAKIAAINTQVELGLKTEVEGRREALALQQQYSGSITETINNLILLLQSLPPDLFARLGAGKLIADLEAARLKAQQVKTEFEIIGENLGGQFAQGAAQAFGVLAKGIAGFLQGANSIGDAFKGAMDSFREFLADFLVGIAQAILQAIILKAIMNAITGGSGGYVDAAVGALGGSNHDGGIVGQDGKARWAPMDVWAKAKRFHDGGLPGLRSNEVPTILELGEEVLTADDPRHVLNGGATGGSSPNTTIINTIDSPSMIEAGLPSKAGTKTLVNVVRANRGALRIALGL